MRSPQVGQSAMIDVLAAYNRGSTFSAEAGLKYFVLGAFSSGVLLYGISLLYGLTGGTRLSTIAGALGARGFDDPMLLIATILLTVGLAVGAYSLTYLKNPHEYRGDPKVIWSILVWVLYLGLLAMRWKFAQGGRRFALGAVGSFVFVLLTFWGTNVLSRIHNP